MVYGMVCFWLPAQPVDATQALNLPAGVASAEPGRSWRVLARHEFTGERPQWSNKFVLMEPLAAGQTLADPVEAVWYPHTPSTLPQFELAECWKG